jgi:hypothetical protein
MTELIAQSRGLDVGRALGDAARVVGRRWQAILALTLGAAWAPQALAVLGFGWASRTVGLAPADLAASLVLVLAVLVLGLFMRAAVTAIALAPGEASIGDALGAALAAVPALAPLWLVGAAPEVLRAVVMRYEAITYAMRGIVVATAAWPLALALALLAGVVTPVAVAERRWFGATLARAFRLMSAGRWAFLGLFLVFQLLATLATYAASLALVLGRPGLGLDIRGFAVANSLATALIGDAVQALWAVVVAMCYRQFRRQLDGPTPGEAADIFA